MKPRISLRDIARHLRLSHTTVSLALRHDPRITKTTRDSVTKAAVRLGYQRDAVVSDLMSRLRTIRTSGKHDTLGFMTAWPTRNGWQESANHRRFFNGAQQRAQEAGYGLDEFWLGETGMTPNRMTSILRARGIRGLVVQSLEKPNGSLSLKWAHFACVTKGLTVTHPRLHRVISSHYDDMQLAVRRLGKRKYRRIGLVLGENHSLRVDRAWHAAYLLHQNDIEAADRVPALILREEHGFDVFRHWLAQHRPDCLLFVDQPVPEWLKRLEISVPAQIGMVHLDWFPELGAMAGIDSDPEAVGVAAIDLLVGQLHAHEYGIPNREKVVEVLGRWVPGDSIR